MYTFNLFCFGHDLSVNKELNNKLREFDIEFKRKVGNKDWQVDFPYHGGQVSGDCYSCVFGTIITDDDNNRNYLNEVRSAKESDYIIDYNQFLKLFLSTFDNYPEIKELMVELKTFLLENKPTFYSVEASS